MNNAETKVPWSYTADMMTACSCDWGCPCNFNAPPTRGFCDARATADQRQALDRIVKGQLGGRPWPIFAPTIETWHETSFVPVEWQLDGARSRYKFGDLARLTMAPMRNPVSGVEVPAKIVLPDGLTCKELNMTTSETFSVFSPGLKYAWPGKMAWYGSTEHGS